MIKTLLIDDEPLARSLVREYLKDYETLEVVQECSDGFEGLKAIQLHKPDLIFLDIQMPKITGFEMLELVEDPPAIIFTTAFDEYAIKAFEANAIDYLLKPFSKERFDKALQKWISHFQSHNPEERLSSPGFQVSKPPEETNRMVVKTPKGIKIIPVTEVLYLEAFDDYVKIHTQEGFFLKKQTLSHYEKALDPKDFVRVHRSFMMAVDQLTRIENPEKDNHMALLKNGVRIPLSRSGYHKLKEVLGI